ADALINLLRAGVVLDGALVDAARGELHVAMRQVVEVGRVAAIDGFVGHAHDSGCRSVLFQAATAAATAGMAFGLDSIMPQFARHAGHTVPDTAIENDASA